MYILIISFLLNVVIGFIGEDTLAGFFTAMPLVGEAVAALVGLIPNCASSVVITELYLGGIIGAGAMMSGLLVNAGVGLLVLFRLNRDWKQNAGIVAALYGLGVFWGVIIRVCGDCVLNKGNRKVRGICREVVMRRSAVKRFWNF